jgi:hypothetical protein
VIASGIEDFSVFFDICTISAVPQWPLKAPGADRQSHQNRQLFACGGWCWHVRLNMTSTSPFPLAEAHTKKGFFCVDTNLI